MAVTIINPFIAAGNLSLQAIIESLGLTTGLQDSLDAGDAALREAAVLDDG